MKRVVTGGFLALIGSIWALSLTSLASDNLVSEWSTPPGRLLTTFSEMNILLYVVLSAVFILLGVLLMAYECVKKDK